ncbi:hypothetical protein C8Q78DRAFT_981169, partial [Trametes maxima]
MSFTRRQAVPRPASTLPTSRVPVSARENAPAKTTRTIKPRKLTPSQEAWREAEQVVSDLDAAAAFLQSRSLIPEGSHAITGESLILGLLHFASSELTHDLTRRSLIAFAYLAKEVLGNAAQMAVSDSVVERAEDQLWLRLDHHTSHVEERMEGLTGTVDALQKELVGCTTELREACGRMKEAEAAFAAAQGSLQELRARNPGEPVPTIPPLTIDSAPVRVHRAATLADLLQRQVLVRGATLGMEDGSVLGESELLRRAREASDEMEKGGLTPPGGGTVESAKVQRHGDTVFTMSSIDMARWLLKQTVAKPFARKMGMKAQVVK